MRYSRKPALALALIFFSTLLVQVAVLEAHQEDTVLSGQASVFQRINQALAGGEFNLKDAVLLKARLLFALQEFPPDSRFFPQPGEVLGHKGQFTEFYQDLNLVLDDLEDEDRQFLESLHPEVARFLKDRIAGRQEAAVAAAPRGISAYAKVARAQADGQIRRKEGVVLKAQLLFAPHVVPLHSPFRPQPGEPPAPEPCLTGLMAELDRVFHELGEGEILRLSVIRPEFP